MLSKIEHYDNAIHSPIWNMIPTALVELQQLGFLFQRNFGPGWDEPVFVAYGDYDPKEIVGYICYRHNKDLRNYFITLSYVLPMRRRNGIHTSLFEALVKRAISKQEISCIESGTHPNNVAAQKAFAKQGRYLSSLAYTYDIAQFEAPTVPFDKSQPDYF